MRADAIPAGTDGQAPSVDPKPDRPPSNPRISSPNPELLCAGYPPLLPSHTTMTHKLEVERLILLPTTESHRSMHPRTPEEVVTATDRLDRLVKRFVNQGPDVALDFIGRSKGGVVVGYWISTQNSEFLSRIEQAAITLDSPPRGQPISNPIGASRADNKRG